MGQRVSYGAGQDAEHHWAHSEVDLVDEQQSEEATKEVDQKACKDHFAEGGLLENCGVK